MKCDKCSASAILFQRYSGLHLCTSHFISDVEKKIKREVRKEKIEGTLAIALSGGKDSAVTLSVLNDLLSRRGVDMIAISVDEGRFSAGVFRAEVRDMLNDLELRHPGTKYSLVRGLGRILQLTTRSPFELGQCTRCKEPAVRTFCQSCEVLEKLRSTDLDRTI